MLRRLLTLQVKKRRRKLYMLLPAIGAPTAYAISPPSSPAMPSLFTRRFTKRAACQILRHLKRVAPAFHTHPQHLEFLHTKRTSA